MSKKNQAIEDQATEVVAIKAFRQIKVDVSKENDKGFSLEANNVKQAKSLKEQFVKQGWTVKILLTKEIL